VFSTLLGPLPPDDDTHDVLATVDALAAPGLELITDGSDPAPPSRPTADIVAAWAAAADRSPVAVKASLLGPYSAAHRAGLDPDAVAETIQPTIVALAAAGCAFVEIAEPAALAIATSPSEASAFRRAHARLLGDAPDVHGSLALTGGNLDGASPGTFFDLGYASFAFDLIAGPDNWRLIAQAPTDRGIVCGALGLGPTADETRELLVWAAHYAASTASRGLARVGLANAPIADPVSRSEILRKLAIVAAASRLASVDDPAEMAGLLDPRALDLQSRAGSRSARAGDRFAPERRRRR
jgi:hypothetical protein